MASAARTLGAALAVGLLAASWRPLAASASSTSANGFRCPTTRRLISLGDSTYEVERKCRAPDDARSHTEMRRQRRTVRIYRNGVVNAYEEEYDVEVVVEDWTYDFGRDRLMRYLRFEQGRLAELNEGGYGSRDPDAEP